MNTENKLIDVIDLWLKNYKPQLPNVRLMAKVAGLDPNEIEKHFLDNPEDLIKLYEEDGIKNFLIL